MTENQNIFTPGPNNSLLNHYGEKVTPPKGWTFLPAGDAGLTRKITSQGTFWRVQIKKGRRYISKGIWAPSEIINIARRELEATRQTDEYKKSREYAAQRREKKQLEYKEYFLKAVLTYLSFHPSHKETEKTIAKAVTKHAIPIGSGTVARTSMLPIEERASRAVIAWMRHNTTVYDQLSIKRIKGERRRVRRLLAEQSTRILSKYRNGLPPDVNCPLQNALKSINNSNS
ncbi:DUF2293 domain-containing protein [Marinilabilia rubra]|uniref:DUF2293 domain-containing protein n=1 Tax=Marinilabilia rubra TaxID=2162893 RepID=A0A2U2BAE1_9BACT|nr:DUF2293 domain-containing protein [Marinilabilia rubra]PWD99996.1 DUF2293 domain-containing protein [Marinilabilia rubra]